MRMRWRCTMRWHCEVARVTSATWHVCMRRKTSVALAPLSSRGGSTHPTSIPALFQLSPRTRAKSASKSASNPAASKPPTDLHSTAVRGP
eukprot:4014374-Pyramimonas_sp.AAC.1